ncbi:MAG: hypothetical protein KI793_05550 [Rivularia sp. (in: Bacteria)]|nr:hypothetical protein [Rivularia sp. MS3]
MVNQFYPSPPINPLHRLSVRDGLEVNAERWQLAHQYHRHRQNIHYQSLNQPGIVSGLGIRITEAPKESQSRYKGKSHWLEIQPGIAIDIEGNPIVVDENINNRKFPFISPKLSQQNFDEEITVYLVVSYEDNQTLIQEEGWKEREWFKFDQQVNPPTPEQVELCRIKLRVEDIVLGRFELKNPEDVFYPQLNEIDLRYRQQAKARPQALVNIATTTPESDNSFHQNTNKNLSYLMQSLNVIYPNLQGSAEVKEDILAKPSELINTDFIYIPSWQITNLNIMDFRKKALDDYRKLGGMILIEANFGDTLEDMHSAISQLFQFPINSWREWHNSSEPHPFKTQPFLFTALPEYIRDIYYSEGILLVFGNLSTAWGGKVEQSSLSRNDIRTAQELGINILSFAWERRNMKRLLSSDI